MTETTLSVTINPFGRTKPGSVGVVVPGMKAKVSRKHLIDLIIPFVTYGCILKKKNRVSRFE